MYNASDDKGGYFSVQEDGALTLVSLSPNEENGISQDTTVVFQWNHHVSPQAGDEAVIRPSARGTWTSAGNSLIFTPQQFAPGTLYTITLPAGTVLNDNGDVLKEDVSLSFETEDPTLRIPTEKSFEIEEHQFIFSENDTIAIPVSCAGDEEAIVTASVYRADSDEAFIDSFGEYFDYPSWAKLSRDNFSASQRNFEKLYESEMAVRSENGVPAVILGSLPQGKYLVRLGAENKSYDVAVTVSEIDAAAVYDHGRLQIWSHKNNIPFAEAVVEVNGKEYSADENGFVSVVYRSTLRDIDHDPSLLGITIKDKEEDLVYFLNRDDIKQQYRSAVILNQGTYLAGQPIKVSGYITTKLGIPEEGEGTLELSSPLEVIHREKIELNDGFFSCEWPEETLTDGYYQMTFLYNGKEEAKTSFIVSSGNSELTMFVESSADTAESGETVDYTVSLRDQQGNAVDNAVVTMNNGKDTAVDDDGKAEFSAAYQQIKSLPFTERSTVFHVNSPLGSCEDVSASVQVTAKSEEEEEDSDTKEAAVQDETVNTVDTTTETEAENRLNLTYDGDSFAVVPAEQSSAFSWQYHDGIYTEDPAKGQMSMNAPGSLTAENGGGLTVNAATYGASRQFAVVSLYKGSLPQAYQNKNIADESINGCSQGILEETRVFFGEEEINAAFSTENRSGDYFIRICVMGENGETMSRYLPAVIDGVTLLCSKEQSFYSGEPVDLSFYVHSEKELDYTLTIGEESYSGQCKGAFSVETNLAGVGRYPGEIVIEDAGREVASADISCKIYENNTLFFDVISGFDEGALYRYDVKAEQADHFSALMEVVLLPGDQILQRMGKTLYVNAFPEQSALFAADADENLLPYQNYDGGFGRYEGGESDLLLSVFVAEQTQFACDRNSLCAYLKYRLSTSADADTAALACWGLSCFGIDCRETMAEIEDMRGISDRGLLYLAEGYEASHRNQDANRLYGQLQKKLSGNNDLLHLNDAEDQYGIANTAFMLDLALKMKKEESQGLLAFLCQSELQNQTSRYLLELSILRILDDNDVALTDQATPSKDHALISLIPQNTGDLPQLSAIYYSDSDKKETASGAVNDILKMELQWEGTENNIYLVCALDSSGAKVIHRSPWENRNGNYETITANNKASLYFRVSHEGKNVTPKVYVVNLTTGEVVGMSPESGIKVDQ